MTLALALVMCLSLIPCAFAAETVSASDKFTDVPANAWYLNELNYAVYNGYISGTSATTFSPDANITVEQMATILTNYSIKAGAMLECNTRPAEYKDDSSVSSWAILNVEYMRQFDLLHTENGYIHPQKAVSRAEGAYTLARFAKAARYGAEPPTSGGDSGIDESLEEKWAEIDAHAAECNAKVQAIHDELWSSGTITANSTEKDKAIAYLKWMCTNCFYGDGVSFRFPKYQSHEAYGALVNGRAVCEGLSLGYLALLKNEGITCETVTSYDHMWNRVTIDGVAYEVDLTEGTALSKNLDGSFKQSGFKLRI